MKNNPRNHVFANGSRRSRALTRLAVCVGVLITVAATACTGSASTAATSTTSLTAAATTETFSGTVAVAGSDSHSFSVAQSGGQLNVIMTAAGPPSTIYMGLGIGAYTSGTCTLLAGGFTVAQAAATAQLAGTVNAGSYCVMVYDAGNQSAAISYDVTVTHY